MARATSSAPAVGRRDEESVEAAYRWRLSARRPGIKEIIQKRDIHIHVFDGVTPKDCSSVKSR
jgi:ATP-dependent Lon protease